MLHCVIAQLVVTARIMHAKPAIYLVGIAPTLVFANVDDTGVPIWEATGFLGMSPEFLQGTYGHHYPDHLQGVPLLLGKKADTFHW